MMKDRIKLGNTSFNIEAVKKMTQKKFEATYKDILKGVELDVAYKKLKGNAKVGEAN